MKKIYILFLLFLSIVGLAQEQTLYWIGGAGNWDDLSHWSFQSGSQNPDTQPSSIPNAQTHVVFDENSGLTGSDAQRTVTIRLASYNIKSFTFTNGISLATAPIINKTGDYSIIVSDNVTFQPFVKFNVPLIGNISEGETKTITMNGILSSGALYEIGKEGLGTLTVDESLNNTNVTVNYGTLKLFGQQLTGGALAVYNNAVLEILNPTTINVNSFRTDATAYVNLPNCTNMNVTGNFSPNSSIPINFPLLENLSVGSFSNDYLSIFNPVLNFPNNSVINIDFNFNYKGTINYSTARFVVANGEVRFYRDMHLHSLTMNHPVGTTTTFYGPNITLDEMIITNGNLGFYNNLTVGNLVLAPSATYIISSNITITESLIASSPDCTPFITLNGNIGGIIKNNTGSTIFLTNVIVENLNSDGLDPINVTGIDDGNNSGSFVFTEPAETTLYWVGDGNDGEWHNIENWSLTSGGQGGYCLPNRYTNVIFDENSEIIGDNLRITNNIAIFHDMIITADAPVFNIYKYGGSNDIFDLNLSCYGSWIMRSGISVNIPTLFLSNEALETITSNTSNFQIVLFSGEALWELQDDLLTSGHFYFQKGTFKTNDKDVFVGGDFIKLVYNNLPRNLILGSSEFSVSRNWEYQDNISLLDAGTSHIIIRGGRFLRVNSNQNYYDISVGLNPYANDPFYVYGDLNAHDVVIENPNIFFQNGISTNRLSLMPLISQLKVDFINNLTTNILELQKNASMAVEPNRIVTINTELITHTDDCEGMMEIYVSNKMFNDKFIFKSFNNMHIPNVLMLGVEADTSTGASYTATGLELGLTENWVFSNPPSRDLYWIGTEDNNWNNGLNWTTNSDGTPSVNGCVPDYNDTVHFNSFSFVSDQQTNIDVRNADAYIADIIVHNDFQGSLSITTNTNNKFNAFGNIFQLKDDVSITMNTNHYGVGTVNFTGGVTNRVYISDFDLNKNGINQIWNFDGVFEFGTLEMWNGEFNYNYHTLNSGYITINGVFNCPDNLNSSLMFKSGVFNGESSIITGGTFDSEKDLPRFLNFENALIKMDNRFLLIGDNITLLASGSKIQVGQLFESRDSLNFNHIETFKASNSNNLVNINGFFNVNKLTLSNNTKINNNLQIGELVILPKNLTLSLAENTTQTITNKMQLNGTPCQFNTIQGLGTGADIAYANPNDNNTFDFVQVSGINATDANINFQVNSSNLGNNNNKVVFLQGSTGVIGLGPDKTCKDSFYILAYGFYGGPLSAYTWYKKDENGDFINLNLPPETISINAIDYGLDGVYKVDMVYDTTLDVNLQCKQSSTVHITFAPMNVGFVNNPAKFCENELVTIADILITQETLDFMDEFNSEILWFANATDSTPLPTSTLLVNGTTYYAILLDDNGCYSNDRMPVLVEFYAKPIANAGPDQIIPNQIQFTMQANNPTVGVGTWTVVFGNVSIADANSYNTQVTILSGESATLRWTVDNNGCTAADTVIIGKSITGNKVPRVNPNLRTRVLN